MDKFISYEKAERDIDKWIKTFPERYDLIIGIPRSGLYVASYIATKLGLPLSTPDNFIRGDIWFISGIQQSVIRKILLVEDSSACQSNGQLIKNYNLLTNSSPKLEITPATLYKVFTNQKETILQKELLFTKTLTPPYCFEWNLMHRKYGVVASDLDGVLCHDWEPDLYESYKVFLEKSQPYLIPKFRIDYIITSREEQYRSLTLNWLKKYSVDFGNLIMIKNHNSSWSGIKNKTKWLKRLHPTWYWESNIYEAYSISKLTNIPILCTDNMTLFTGGLSLSV